MTTFTRIRINSQGYDSFGSYWGNGPRLYQLSSDDIDLDGRAFRLGHVVRIHPATDLFMRGVTSARIDKVGRKYLTVYSGFFEQQFKVPASAIDWDRS